MTLIAASIFSKSGKRLLCRQFLNELPKSRLEGLMDSFPKLVINDKGGHKQHTYVETDSVRYVYQPLDLIYVVLVTTKTSNIMEDLECLRLFARIIPEYCRSNDETEVFNNCFELIAAFDEVVVLGYRESVNLAQIRTFTEMDSQEERIFNQIQIAQQRVAKNNMLEKAKEMQMKKKMGALPSGFQSGFGKNTSSTVSSTPSSSMKAPVVSTNFSASESYKSASKIGGGGKALKLGAKTATEDTFLQQLRSEGQAVVDNKHPTVAETVGESTSVHRDAVHLRAIEKITASLPRGGGLDSAEVQGSVSFNVTDPAFNTAVVHIKNPNQSGAQLQVHPNLDKKAWQASSALRLKSVQKPFPVNVDVGILKWRLSLSDEDDLPLTIVCWPNESPNGCSVNVEYTLQREDLTLENVQIVIPLPPATAPVVSECEGDYEYLKSKSVLVWTIPSIDGSNKTGTLEFEVPNGDSDHFFPVNVNFKSESLFVGLGIDQVTGFESGEPIPFSSETRLVAEEYHVN